MHTADADAVCRNCGGDLVCDEAEPLFEFEVHLASNDDLKSGVLATQIVKYVVADTDWWDAYQTAIDLAWRGNLMVTACHWVL